MSNRVRLYFDLARKVMSGGAFWVLTLSLLIVAVAVLATWHWWCILSVGDTPTDIFRNVAFIAGGFIAWIFAFWRSSIASQQVEIAKEENQHMRFQNAANLLAQQGLPNSYARISGLHAFRHLVHDAPDFGPEALEVLSSFMILTPVDEDHDLSEFTLARITAEFICDTMDRLNLPDAASRERLREDLIYTLSLVKKKFYDAGLDPNQPPH